jgi:hypothetical protein
MNAIKDATVTHQYFQGASLQCQKAFLLLLHVNVLLVRFFNNLLNAVGQLRKSVRTVFCDDSASQ